jgi:transposase InsO family protein
MSTRVGSSTIYSTILPNNAAWAKVRNVQLSREAKFRLRVIEHYLLTTKNVSLTCRHYAITRSYFYKWYKRFNPKNLSSLEDLSRRYYGFVAVDPYTKQAVVHVATKSSSYQAKLALEKVLDIFGKDICILNDNGSENFGKALTYLRDQNITQYFARPRTPKDKPHVENLIGKLQQECLDEHGDANSLEELQRQITKWVNDYHFFRPHQALNYLTPQEFCDTLDITIPLVRPSTM